MRLGQKRRNGSIGSNEKYRDLTPSVQPRDDVVAMSYGVDLRELQARVDARFRRVRSWTRIRASISISLLSVRELLVRERPYS